MAISANYARCSPLKDSVITVSIFIFGKGGSRMDGSRKGGSRKEDLGWVDPERADL